MQNGSVARSTVLSARLGLAQAKSLAQARAGGGPVHVVIDATGLKVFSAGEWLAQKQGERGRRTWRKLHLAMDCGTGEILACELTTNEAGDASQIGPLLEQISGPLGAVIADGAYDGEPVYRAVSDHQPDPPVDVVIPPRSTAAPSAGGDAAPTQRDRHVQLIREGAHGVAKSDWIRQTIAGGDGHVAL